MNNVNEPCFEHGAPSKANCRRCQELGSLTPDRDVSTGDPNNGPCLTHGAPNKSTCERCREIEDRKRRPNPPAEWDLPWKNWPSDEEDDEAERQRRRKQADWNERKRQQRNRSQRGHTPSNTSTHAYQPGFMGKCRICNKRH